MKEPGSRLVVALYLVLWLGATSAVKADIIDNEMLLQPIDAHLNQKFGHSVAINGTNAVIGAPENAQRVGAAYVYSKFGTNWLLQQKLVPIQAATNELVGFSVAINGNLLALGAPGFDPNPSTANPGGVYVYMQTNGVWLQQARLNEPDGQRGDRFGVSVALSGQSIVIGSSFHSDFRATNNGAIYVFDLTAIGWQLSAKIVPNDLTNNSFFGQSVAMSGDTVIVGANNSLVGPTNFPLVSSGAAYVFVRRPVTSFFAPWSLQQKLLPTNLFGGTQFGFSVAIEGETALVGAPSTANGGAVDAFVRSNGIVWTQQTQIVASNLTRGDRFGASVALQGTRAVIGAPNKASNNVVGVGAAYVFSQLPEESTNAVSATNRIAALLQPPTFRQTNALVFTNASGEMTVFVPTDAPTETNVVAETNSTNVTNAISENNAGWVQEQEMRPLQTSTDFHFGFSVAVGTPGILVGTPFPTIGTGDGAAYVFTSSESILSILSATATPSVLTPQTVSLVPVTISVVTSDTNATSRIVSVTSNQSVVGQGVSSTTPDWIITGPLTLLLRAENDNAFSVNRVYNILVESADRFGNLATVNVPVIVLPATQPVAATLTP